MATATPKDITPSEQAMIDDGREITEKVQQDYFGTDTTYRYIFPDDITWVEFKVMNEGDRARYQRETLREVTVRKQSGDTSLQVDPAKEREILLDNAYQDWNLLKGDVPAPAGKANFKAWREKANPKLIDEMMKCVRENNPFLITDNMNEEEILREIDDLNRKLDMVRETNRGK